MKKEIYWEHFRLQGRVLAAALEFSKKRQEVFAQQRARAKEKYGAIGVMVSSRGESCVGLLVKKEAFVEKGMEKFARIDREFREKGGVSIYPRRNTKEGKKFDAFLDAMPESQRWGDFLESWGAPQKVETSTRLCTSGVVDMTDGPTPMIFAQIPRVLGDGWKEPEDFVFTRVLDFEAACAGYEKAKGRSDDSE